MISQSLDTAYRILDKIPELPFFAVALAYILLVPRSDYTHLFSTAFLFLAASIIVGSALKLIVKTRRPRKLTDCILFKYGFPSLHAMISVGAVGFVYFISPPIALVLAPVGLLFMRSRVELHYHTRTDVWGGAAIGLFLGAVSGGILLDYEFSDSIEFLLATLFFVTPVVFSIFRVKHKI